MNKTYIFLCTGKSCKKHGGKELGKVLANKKKESDREGRVQIVRTKCLDMCDYSPNMIMNNRLYSRVDKKQALAILEEGMAGN